MSKKLNTLNFDEVCDLFISLGANNTPSEMHGLLAGQLAAGKRMDMDGWLKEAIEFLDTETDFSKEQREQLQFIYMATLTAIADEELGFHPLLPDESTEIEQQLQCLGLWCTGFLAGFALVEKKITDLPEIVNDALNDLAAISQIGTNDDEELDTSAEEDFFQITEYVRLAAMNIFIEYAVDEAESAQANAENKSDEYLDSQSLFKGRQVH